MAIQDFNQNISREDYLKALIVVEGYHNQVSAMANYAKTQYSISETIVDCSNGTPLLRLLSNQSARIYNSVHAYIIEEIRVKTFLVQKPEQVSVEYFLRFFYNLNDFKKIRNLGTKSSIQLVKFLEERGFEVF